MKSYKELAEIAEKVVDEVMKGTAEEALESGVVEAIEFFEITLKKSEEEENNFSTEEKAEKIKKMIGYMDRLIEPSLKILNKFDKLHCIWVLYEYVKLKDALALPQTTLEPKEES